MSARRRKGISTKADRLRSWPFAISIPSMHRPLRRSRPSTPLQKFHFLDISPETDRSFRKSPYKLREIHFDTSSGIGADRAYLYPFPYNHPRFQSRELLFLTCYSRKEDDAKGTKRRCLRASYLSNFRNPRELIVYIYIIIIYTSHCRL